jgi:SagB-type dehydrogenase family enzyme
MQETTIALPAARKTGTMSVEAMLASRRSIRDFRDEAMSLADLAQLVWAAQGVTDPEGYRTAPSAGALYPLELYVVVGDVPGLDQALYRYVPAEHALEPVIDGDLRSGVGRAALDQDWITRAPAILVFAAETARTTRKYGDRGIRYVHIEVGHAAENVYLQAGALGLGTTIVGAFSDDAVKRALRLNAQLEPLAIMPVGRW